MKRTIFVTLTLLFGMLLYLQTGFTQFSLPAGAKLRIGRGYETGSSMFSEDGSRFAIASNIGVWVYDVFDWHPLALLTRHSSYFSVIVSSPDGGIIASATNNEIALWDIFSGRRVGRFTDHNQDVRTLAFSPDGKTLASGSADDTIRLWNTTTGRLLSLPLNEHTGDVISLAFSPDGRLLASGSTDNSIRLWSATTGEPLATLEHQVVWGVVTDGGHTGDVTAVAFSPDGETLASGATDHTIRLWNVRTRQHITTLGGHSGTVSALAFSGNGNMLASGSTDNTVRLWNPATGRYLAILEGHNNNVTTLAFSENRNTLASGDAGDTVRLWDGNTGQYLTHRTLGSEIDKPDSLRGSDGSFQPLTTYREIRAVAFSPDGVTLASGHGETSYFSNVRVGTSSNRRVQRLAELLGIVSNAGNNRSRILMEKFGYTSLRNASNGGYHSTPTDTFLPTCVAFSANGKIFVSGGEYIGTRTSRTRWCPVFGGGCYYEYYIEGVSYNYPVALRNFDTNRSIILKGHTSRVSSIAISPDGRVIATGSWDDTIRLWSSTTGQHLTTYHGHWNDINTVAFSPAGGMLASGSDDNTIKLWNPDGQVRATLHGHDGSVNSVAFSPNGKVLASGSDDQTVRLWNPITRELITTLEGHTSWVRSVAFSPAGGMLASGSDDRTIRLWNSTTGEHLQTLHGHRGSVYSVAFSPDGTTLASGSGDSTILLWEIEPAASGDPLDVNGDGIINILDLTAVAANFGKTGQTPADVNGDGVVNINDIVLVAGAMETAPAAPSISPQILQTLTAEDIEKWLPDAEELKITQPWMQKGIATLKQLLEVLRQAEVIPTETALLPNYPNPFNPETWIPYQLAKPAEVRVRIYSADGRLIRTLALGHQPVGIYQSRSRASYWDGKNELGEPVASGVYFYTLTAGEFTATRKMLIQK